MLKVERMCKIAHFNVVYPSLCIQFNVLEASWDPSHLCSVHIFISWDPCAGMRDMYT